MNESNARIGDGLKKAIAMEADGYHFYNMAARSVTDPLGQETFETLANEELGHMRFLDTQLHCLTEKGGIDTGLKLGPRADFSGSVQIFSDEILKRAKEAHMEMSALSIGIRLEKASVDFYEDRAGSENDAAVRAFYKELAEWEAGHYHALLRQQDLLKEDYWSAGGFAPF